MDVDFNLIGKEHGFKIDQLLELSNNIENLDGNDLINIAKVIDKEAIQGENPSLRLEIRDKIVKKYPNIDYLTKKIREALIERKASFQQKEKIVEVEEEKQESKEIQDINTKIDALIEKIKNFKYLLSDTNLDIIKKTHTKKIENLEGEKKVLEKEKSEIVKNESIAAKAKAKAKEEAQKEEKAEEEKEKDQQKETDMDSLLNSMNIFDIAIKRSQKIATEKDKWKKKIEQILKWEKWINDTDIDKKEKNKIHNERVEKIDKDILEIKEALLNYTDDKDAIKTFQDGIKKLETEKNNIIDAYNTEKKRLSISQDDIKKIADLHWDILNNTKKAKLESLLREKISNDAYKFNLEDKDRAIKSILENPSPEAKIFISNLIKEILDIKGKITISIKLPESGKNKKARYIIERWENDEKIFVDEINNMSDGNLLFVSRELNDSEIIKHKFTIYPDGKTNTIKADLLSEFKYVPNDKLAWKTTLEFKDDLGAILFIDETWKQLFTIATSLERINKTKEVWLVNTSISETNPEIWWVDNNTIIYWDGTEYTKMIGFTSYLDKARFNYYKGMEKDSQYSFAEKIKQQNEWSFYVNHNKINYLFIPVAEDWHWIRLDHIHEDGNIITWKWENIENTWRDVNVNYDLWAKYAFTKEGKLLGTWWYNQTNKKTYFYIGKKNKYWDIIDIETWEVLLNVPEDDNMFIVKEVNHPVEEDKEKYAILRFKNKVIVKNKEEANSFIFDLDESYILSEYEKENIWNSFFNKDLSDKWIWMFYSQKSASLKFYDIVEKKFLKTNGKTEFSIKNKWSNVKIKNNKIVWLNKRIDLPR